MLLEQYAFQIWFWSIYLKYFSRLLMVQDQITRLNILRRMHREIKIACEGKQLNEALVGVSMEVISWRVTCALTG